MKNISKISLVIAFVMALFSGAAISIATGWEPIVTVPAVFAFAFITAPDGVLMYTLASVTKSSGDKNGGTKVRVLWAPIADFATIKGFKTTTNPGDSVTIDGTHVFTGALGFAELYITLDTAELNAILKGERDGRSKELQYEGEHPGTNKLFEEMGRHTKNVDGIALVPMADGTNIQIGTEDFPAELTTEFKSGKLTGPGAKNKVMITMPGAQSLAYYEGTITLL